MRTRSGRTAAILALAAALAGPALAGDEEDLPPGPDLLEVEGEPGRTEGRKYYSLGARAGPWLGFLDVRARFAADFDLDGAGSAEGRIRAGVEDVDVMPFAEAFLTLKYVAIYADYWQGSWQDETRAGADFSFRGVEFSGDAPVETELDLLTASARIQVNPLALDLVEVGLSIGARYFRADAALRGEDPTETFRAKASRRAELPIPQVGVAATVFIGRWADVYARARGLGFTYDDWDVIDVEGEAGLAFNIGDHISIGAEYRLVYLELEDRDEDRRRIGHVGIAGLLHGASVYVRVRF